ncbi:MAG TPA: hypothetical protein VJB15_10725 [Rhodothermia bacterium]|nr:hypothetical protein [Rhodothermia bacterium]
MLFDSTGAMERSFLRRGEGPGEMSNIVGMETCGGGDSIVVADRFRVAVFNSEGEFARDAQYRTGGQLRSLVGVSSDCRRLLVVHTVQPPPQGSVGLVEDALSWLDPLGQITDPVVSASAFEVWTRQLYGAERPFVVPWGTFRTYSLIRDTIVAGYGRLPELRRYDASGKILSITRWDQEPRPVTHANRSRYESIRREWLASMPDDPESRFLFPDLHEYPDLPATFPLFDRILVADDGTTWLRSFPDNSFGAFDARLRHRPVFAETWSIFDSEGVWLGELALPERFELDAVAGSRLYGVSRDADEVQTVQVLHFHTPNDT